MSKCNMILRVRDNGKQENSIQRRKRQIGTGGTEREVKEMTKDKQGCIFIRVREGVIPVKGR